VSKGTQSGDFLLDFSSSATREAAIGKEVKVAGKTLKIEPNKSGGGKQAEFGVFFPGVKRSDGPAVSETLKRVCNVDELRFTGRGVIVAVLTAEDEKKLLGATVTNQAGETIKPEVLKNKAVAAN